MCYVIERSELNSLIRFGNAIELLNSIRDALRIANVMISHVPSAKKRLTELLNALKFKEIYSVAVDLCIYHDILPLEEHLYESIIDQDWEDSGFPYLYIQVRGFGIDDEFECRDYKAPLKVMLLYFRRSEIAEYSEEHMVVMEDELKVCGVTSFLTKEESDGIKIDEFIEFVEKEIGNNSKWKSLPFAIRRITNSTTCGMLDTSDQEMQDGYMEYPTWNDLESLIVVWESFRDDEKAFWEMIDSIKTNKEVKEFADYLFSLIKKFNEVKKRKRKK